MNIRDPLHEFRFHREGQEDIGALAQRSLTNDPLLYIVLHLFLTAFGMAAGGAIDLALNYSLMSAGFSDALGRTPDPVGLYLGSGVMLIAYFGLSQLYRQSFELRRFAYIGYAGLVGITALIAAPVYTPRINEMWSGMFSVANPFGGSTDGGQAPTLVKAVLIGMIAVLYTGPGLVAVWSKGRFHNGIERLRNRQVAKKTLALAREKKEQEERQHQAATVVDHLSDPARQAQAIRTALRQGISAYAAEIERKGHSAQNVLLDASTSKAMKRQAEIDFDASARCKVSLQTIIV